MCYFMPKRPENIKVHEKGEREGGRRLEGAEGDVTNMIEDSDWPDL